MHELARRHPGHAQPQDRARASRVVKELRPDAAADPGLRGRAEPGLDQPHRQRAATRWTASGTLTVRTAPRRTTALVVEIGDTGPGIPPDDPARGSSSRSSPPSRSARAPGSAWTSPTGSWSTGTTATSGWSPSRADRVPGPAADDRGRRVKPVSAQPCSNTADSRRGSAAGPVRRRPAGCAGPGPRRPG